MTDVQVTVVGGGIVGCAVAAESARRGLATVLLEREAGLGRGTTSRNSEVAHGGMYYPTGTLKAELCVRGRRLLKQFCDSHAVSYRECGKLIVAVDEPEIVELERLFQLGQSNGVQDLRLIDRTELTLLEPRINAQAALHSPRTGILDAEGAARALGAVAEDHGAQIMTAAKVVGLERTAGHWQVVVEPAADQRTEGWRHSSQIVVNAAGLNALTVAQLAGCDTAAKGWRLYFVKGNYFALNPEHAGKIKGLVYPVPPADGSSLGVHVCLDLAGQLRLGPDTESVQAMVANSDPTDLVFDFAVDEGRAPDFFTGAKRFLPWLRTTDLTPAMSGVRPKLAPTGFEDFVISRETGPLTGLINLVGIDSPGLTSAPAIAELVGEHVAEVLA